MSTINDGLLLNNPRALDLKNSKFVSGRSQAFASVSEAHAAHSSAYRNEVDIIWIDLLVNSVMTTIPHQYIGGYAEVNLVPAPWAIADEIDRDNLPPMVLSGTRFEADHEPDPEDEDDYEGSLTNPIDIKAASITEDLLHEDVVAQLGGFIGTTANDIEITDATKGYILTDTADDSRWRITITNGVLITTQIV